MKKKNKQSVLRWWLDVTDLKQIPMSEVFFAWTFFLDRERISHVFYSHSKYALILIYFFNHCAKQWVDSLSKHIIYLFVYLQCIQPTCRSFFFHPCSMIITEWAGECGNICFLSAIYARKLPCRQQPTSPSTSAYKWHQASVKQIGNTHGCPFAAQRWPDAAGQDKGLLLQIQGCNCAVWTSLSL